MRRLGTILTVLALVAAQAPWLICDCAEGAITPQLLGGLGDSHEASEESSSCACGHDHGHHHGHGHDHAHDHGHHHAPVRHCHGTYTHTHEDDEDRRPSGHIAFRLPLGTMPAAVALDDAAPCFAPLALLFDASALPASNVTDVVDDDRPPGDPVAPSVRTERLLL